jgi:hypothetical protein
MSRHSEIIHVQDGATAVAQLTDILTAQGFSRTADGRETVWKKGMGLLMGPQYIQFTSEGPQITLHAWVKFAILPGLYVGEMGLTGFLGALPKRKLKDRVDHIRTTLSQG